MKIEISKEQINNLTQKMLLCVDFLKEEVQPHLTKKDKLVIPAGNNEDLELHITSRTLYIVELSVSSLGPFELCRKKTYTMVKNKKAKKKDKHYICEAHPEAAIEFLKQWEYIRTTLTADVAKKVTEVEKIDAFIDGFTL